MSYEYPKTEEKIKEFADGAFEAANFLMKEVTRLKEEKDDLEHEVNRMKQYANLYKLKAKQLGWCVSHSDHQDVCHGDDMPKGLTQSELIN